MGFVRYFQKVFEQRQADHFDSSLREEKIMHMREVSSGLRTRGNDDVDSHGRCFQREDVERQVI